MKNPSLPYFRTFLLLTACVGLLGNAKILLLHNNKAANQTLIASVNRHTPQANKPVTPLATKVSMDSVVSHQASDHKGSSSQKESSTRQESLIQQESLAFKKPSNSKEMSGSPEDESSKKVIVKESKNPSIDTTMESLSDAITNDSIASTIKSLEKMIEELSKNPKTQLRSDISRNVELPTFSSNSDFQNELAMQAERRLQSNVTYDGRYLKIGYPMGDVPANMGVCTDVVIRAYRGLGIDLQQRVHEDMRRNFRSYPNNWQLSKPDSNIDHRRVPNLMTYFKRAGASLPVSNNPLDYHAGDIVAWDMGNGLTHIGIVSTYVSEKTNNPLIVHNIGVGPEMTDILFDFRIIGHYKYGGRSYRMANL